MIEHVFLPSVSLQETEIYPQYRKWLNDWLENVYKNIDIGIIASSVCLQAALSELVLYRKIQTDWLGVLDLYLKNEAGEYLAYSEQFGKLLNGFAQSKQSPIHAIYTHWWLRKLLGQTETRTLGQLITHFVQPTGWIYNPAVSQTGIRTRMKSEIFMSQFMGIEILLYEQMLKKDYCLLFEATLSSTPFTGYVSAEYYRLRTLMQLNRTELAPSSISEIFLSCKAGWGYCDFCLESKVDDYMGTAKRTARDKVIHSPLISLWVKFLADTIGNSQDVNNRLKEFGKHLIDEPFDIPAFRMRDIEAPFGIDLTPLELIAVSAIISLQ
jgi:hypothetical protein